MSHDLFHHAFTTILQVATGPHPLNSAPSDPGAHPNLGGCVNSPEAATDILMAFGAAGLYYGSNLARKFSHRKKQNF